MAEGQVFQERMQRIAVLIRELERLADPTTQGQARELVQALLDLHRAGLARVMEIISRASDGGRGIIAVLGHDEWAGSLLLLHGLHPVDVETRVRGALDQVRSRGGDFELLAVSRDLVRLRLRGPESSTAAVKLAVEEAIVAAAPDVNAVEIEGPGPESGPSRRLSLPVLAGPPLLRPR